MRLTADSNVLFTFFWKKSVLRDLLGAGLILFAPSYSLEEIERHSTEIMDKAGCTKKEFEEIKQELSSAVSFIPVSVYSSFLREASMLAEGLSKNERDELLDDIDFLALALKLGCPLWSNDALLKKQKKIIVLSTREIILLMEPPKKQKLC